MEPLKAIVKKHAPEKANVVIPSSGNLLELPYEDNYFDYTAVNGVLIHLANMDELKSGFKEASSLTKKNGFINVKKITKFI